eukprot:scaffold207907_cov48-Prasinocladus_malaysianus.AAC.1
MSGMMTAAKSVEIEVLPGLDHNIVSGDSNKLLPLDLHEQLDTGPYSSTGTLQGCGSCNQFSVNVKITAHLY